MAGMGMATLAGLLRERPLQQLPATELRSCIALLEAELESRTARLEAELESRTARLDALPDEIQQLVFGQLCDALDPRAAVAYSSASKGLREPMQRVDEGASKSLLEQLKEENAAAAALCRKAGLRGFKELREAMWLFWKDLSTADLATLGKLLPVLPALRKLHLFEASASVGPDCVRLLAGLGAGALPAATCFLLVNMRVGDAGASALAGALDRGALPRLVWLDLRCAAIGDAGLAALAPALRRRPALQHLVLCDNPFGDKGLAALVAPPPPAGMPAAAAGGLKKLKGLDLRSTQITDAGCAQLASRLRSGALPALEHRYLRLDGIISASDAAMHAVYEAARRR